MRLNEKKFFELAKENKFEAADIFLHKNSALSVSIFRGKVDSLTQNDNTLITARGLVGGKFGSVTTEQIDKNTPEFLINSIKRTAKVIENADPAIIFKGSKKYHKKLVFIKETLSNDIDGKIRLLLDIEKKLFAYDKRINEVVTVGYEENSSEERLSNSYGLKLSQKQAECSIFAEVTVKDGEEVRTGYHVFASLDFNDFNEEAFVKNVAEDALSKLGSIQCASKKYPVILNPDAASTLLKYLINSADAEEIQKHSSKLEGKLHQKIVSKKLTITEDPLKKSIFFRYFDDEGVATQKRQIIKKGVLETYLYTLQTAAIDNVEPTGNGYRVGGKASADTSLIVVKPGKPSEEELMSSIDEGVYINNLEGLHAGMNAQSGNFSLQCSGFMIKNGKLAEPLSLITVADNLFEMFNKVKAIGNNTKFVLRNAMECPSLYIKKMAISGK